MTSNAEPPVATVVVPLHDGAAFIEATLRSVLRQTLARFEVIVVDDGSADDGPELVASMETDPRVRLLRRPHRGVAAARNAGAEEADRRSRYLLFLDADDLLDAEALQALVDALDRRPDAAGSFVLAEYVDGSGDVMRPGDFPRHMRGREDLREGRLVPRDSAADVRFEHLFLSNPVYPPSCLLIRRAAYDAAGGFDGRFLAEDWEFVARLAKQGPLVPVDRVLVGYRRHSANASGDRTRNVWGARQVWAALYGSDDHSRATRWQLRGIWRAHQARTARRKFAEGRTLVASGRVSSGVRRVVDGAAHALLRRPPRLWIRQGERLRARERHRYQFEEARS